MDSGVNSGSLQQSSSGAEDVCDSRVTVQDSGLITTHYQPHQPPPPFNHHIHPHNQITNNNPLFLSSTPHHDHDPLLNLDSLPFFSDQTNVNSKISLQIGSGEGEMMTKHTSILEDGETATTTIDPSTNPLPPARNPKKRSRASRKAPTTVLTTDTLNFRAKVQQFTGIPGPPFASTSPAFPTLTTSLDLFGRSSTSNFDHNLQSYLFPPRQYSSLINSCNLLNTMQNPINFPYNNPFNQSPVLNLKPTDHDNLNSSTGFGVIGQTQIHEHHTTLPDLQSTAATPTTTSSRNDDPVASGNWDGCGGGDNYNDGKESSSLKGDQGFIEPWSCSSDQ